MTYTKHLNLDYQLEECDKFTLTEIMNSFGPGCILLGRDGEPIMPVPIIRGRCEHGTLTPGPCWDCAWKLCEDGDWREVVDLRVNEKKVRSQCPSCECSDTGVCFPCFLKLNSRSP